MLCKVIVDENVGPGSPVWEQFQRLFGETPVDYLYLKDVHRGIPDVEVLDKLLNFSFNRTAERGPAKKLP